MPLILETIVTTRNADGSPHLVPFGLIADGDDYVVAPFRPSPTIANLERHPYLAAATPARHPRSRRLRHRPAGLGDRSLRADRVRAPRATPTPISSWRSRRGRTIPSGPRFRCRVVHAASHRPVIGDNRARAAVIEAAILSTRLHMLPAEKVRAEMAYLAIAVGKTAGPAETEAWCWIEDKIRAALDPDRGEVRIA